MNYLRSEKFFSLKETVKRMAANICSSLSLKGVSAELNE